MTARPRPSARQRRLLRDLVDAPMEIGCDDGALAYVQPRQLGWVTLTPAGRRRVLVSLTADGEAAIGRGMRS